ncbi:MAG: hypothetical protein ACTSR8_00725 [Promethearchaeota archaeon]
MTNTFLFYMGLEDTDFVLKHYTCKVCNNASHTVKLNKKLVEGRSRFPFPYITMHSEVLNDELKEFMVMLYIDKDLQIRGVEPLTEEDAFFTKEQMLEITGKLLEEIEVLREENLRLVERLNLKNGK